MGDSCIYIVPAPARLRDVADVIAMMLGNPAELRRLAGFSESTYAYVEGIRYIQVGTAMDKNNTYGIRYEPEMPEWVFIQIKAYDGIKVFNYDYEWDAMGNHGILLSSTPGNIALCVGLCDFFGGVVDFNNNDDITDDYRQPVREDIHAQDGQPWQSFQNRKLSVKPLTSSDIAKYRSVFNYK